MTNSLSASRSSGVRTLLRLGWSDRLLLGEAALRLAFARLVVALLPFSLLRLTLGKRMAESCRDDNPAQFELLRRVRWSVGVIGRRAPWRSKCLERAIAARMMLHARGVTSTLYLGVAREGREIRAHAWLRSGSLCITGGDGSGHYAIVSTFADR